jgi:hypothetical protein
MPRLTKSRAASCVRKVGRRRRRSDPMALHLPAHHSRGLDNVMAGW